MESNLNVEVGAFQLQGDFTRLERWWRITASPTTHTETDTNTHKKRTQTKRRSDAKEREERGDAEGEEITKDG